jgi:hypothetical protein
MRRSQHPRPPLPPTHSHGKWSLQRTAAQPVGPEHPVEMDSPKPWLCCAECRYARSPIYVRTCALARCTPVARRSGV